MRLKIYGVMQNLNIFRVHNLRTDKIKDKRFMKTIANGESAL